MFIGADYYPEHWDEDRWETDAEMMKKCGLNVVRMGEFAWSRMEPEDGEFRLDWLDRVIELLGRHAIQVVLGTPTAAPPAWLIAKHPDILPIENTTWQGRRNEKMEFGTRRHYCITNGRYHDYSRRIVAEMAGHFVGNQNVVGWQVDNEFGDPKCYCDGCRGEFHDWLRKKYGSLEQLNRAWGNAFWSQEYSRWEQIPMPWHAGSNPGFYLDFCRFHSEMVVRYGNMQIETIHSLCPNHFVTHNTMGLRHQDVDLFRLGRQYDFISYDSYPRSPDNFQRAALDLDFTRGIKKKNFWIMEQQCSYLTREGVTSTFPPGVMRLFTYQSIAHGADGILYFRWRPALFGIEQFHSGILQHDGTENSISYVEAKQVAEELRKLSPYLDGSAVKSDAAILIDYDNLWSNRSYMNRDLFPYLEVVGRFYNALRRRGLNVDFVQPTDDLTRYKIAIAPLLYIVDSEVVANLRAFVENGGTLIASFRSGIKDRNNNMADKTLPGELTQLFGIGIHAWDTLPQGKGTKVRTSGPPLGRGEYEASLFADLITLQTAESLAIYVQGWYEGHHAVTVSTRGKGKAIYVGTHGGEELYQRLFHWLLPACGIEPLFSVPQGVEVCTRTIDRGNIIFVLNFNHQERRIPLPGSYQELLGEGRTVQELKVAPYGVAVLVPSE